MYKLFLGLIVSASTLLSGCGYQIGSMTVGGIKTIAITSVENKTGKSFIEESSIINELNSRFIQDGTINVVSPDLSDAYLKITLINYDQRAEVFDSSDVGKQFRLLLTAKVKVIQKTTGKVLYNQEIKGEADYETSLDQSEIERVATNEAIEDLSIDIVQSLLEGGW